MFHQDEETVQGTFVWGANVKYEKMLKLPS